MPKRMWYHDNTKAYIDLQPGRQVLKGRTSKASCASATTDGTSVD